MDVFRLRMTLLFLCTAVLVAGCGGADRPPLGYVSGVVTMNGEPVENAIVVMKPEIGRQAIGKTDAQGRYGVEYNLGEKGTKVGPNVVHVEWPFGELGEFVIPKKYGMGNTELKLDVVKGQQTFDIAMEGDASAPAENQKRAFAD